MPLSCYACRTRKLKCDRSHPCSNCVKREGSDTPNCSYAAPVARKKNSQSAGSSSPDDMQNRIDRLEGLVLSLMHGGASVEASPPNSGAAGATQSGSTMGSGSMRNDIEDDGMMRDDEEEDSDVDGGLASSLGVLKVDPDRGKSLYFGQEAWHTILTDISEVKTYFTTHKKDLERSYEKVLQSKPASAIDPPTFLFGAPPTTEGDLRAELPPKSTVLLLTQRCFNSMDNAVNIIHLGTFHEMLRNHYHNPKDTPIMWLGMLYSVLCLAMLSYHKVGDEPPEWKGRTLELAAVYRTRTVQCLVIGDYTKPVEYTLETMILYLFGEFSSRWDRDLSLWLIGSIIVRLAFRMGYHRDPKWFPLTPYQGEMRRRLWALVRMTDVMFSHHVSLPNMIYDHDCDTELPGNYLDEDFRPDTKVLPPPRPQSEPTPLSYLLAKSKLCIECGNILQAVSRVRNQVSYDEILRFDARLREIRAELPRHLKMQPIEGCQDPLTLIMNRHGIEILYQKIMCLLHRKYTSRSRHNPRYAHSRRSAIEASLENLRILHTLHQESLPNGRLRSLRWYVNTIATKDFMLPAMLIAVDLHVDNAGKRGSTPSGGRHDSQTGIYFWTPEQHQEMITALERTQAIWETMADASVEAFKAANICRIVLEKISTTGSTPEASSGQDTQMRSGAPAYAAAAAATSDAAQPDAAEQAALGLNMLSSGGLTPNTAALFGGSVQSPGGTAYPAADLTSSAGMSMMPDFSVLDGTSGAGAGAPMSVFDSIGGNMDNMDFSTNFDWESFQNYAQTATFGADQSLAFFSNDGQQGSTSADGTGQQPFQFQ